ncbi:DUF2207 domain-containing protein [uncultured Methanosphaera sp.]|uniref:DUF2207 domain-containing protein n=1 Tax=uncultured Methanosphaera sp. TaxID=262501 RepID=UPI002804E074|nr:DUF2207 domain-containing protein [uncultured Methanosphaera sp.]
MFNKKYVKYFIVLSTILLMMLAPIYSLGDYSITNVNEDMTVLDDGTAQITQTITYNITGEINGVYRTIPLSGNQSIENLTVTTPGYYNELEVQNTSTGQEVKVWLYKDKEKTQKVSDAIVNVTYHYNFLKGVKIYNDIAEVQYNVWGDSWDSEVDNLHSTLTIPGPMNEAQYWLNPPDIVKSQKVTSNSLITEYENIASDNTNVEQRIIMPKSYFKSYDNADVINKDAKEIIIADEKKYQDGINNTNNAMLLILIADLILIILPIIIYFKYGREHKINFETNYLTDIPYNDSPAVVNALTNKECGDITIDAFQATLLNLIDRGYLKIIYSNEKDMVLKVNYDKYADNTELLGYENSLINYLREFEDEDNNDYISLEYLKDNEDPQHFIKYFKSWTSTVRENEKLYEKTVKIFNDKGYWYGELASILGIIFGFLAICAGFILGRIYALPVIIASVILFVESLIIARMPSVYFGSYTIEGCEYVGKWNLFKNYIKDYSLIKEYPPQSVQIWGKYLVYATALGCAESVEKNMRKYFNTLNLSDDELYSYPLLGVGVGYDMGFFMMFSTFNHLNTIPTANSDNSFGDLGSFGDIGDIGGGGFGGGGGGVF